MQQRQLTVALGWRSIARTGELPKGEPGKIATSALTGRNHYEEEPMPDPADLPQLLTMDQLAERLGVTRRHVRRLVAERRVPFLRVGRFIRFDPTEVTAWLNSHRVAGSRIV